MPMVTAIILLPLAAALALAIPDTSRMQARIIALLAAGLSFAMVVSLTVRLDRDAAGLQFVDQHSWVSDAALQWAVGVDGISIWLLLLTSGIVLLGLIATAWRPPEREVGFLAAMLAGEAGLLGLFAAADLVVFYIFWEAMLVPFFFLIGMWGSEGRVFATTKFIIYTMVGSLPMLVAILATAFIAQDTTGQLTFTISELRGVSFTETQSTWLFAGFALAFAIKVPVWPFHGWLPDAYRAAPLVVTAVLAAVMSKAGVYGLIRIGVPTFPDGAENFAIILSVLALVGIIYGSLVAWRAPTMRMLVGYSSLAHLGFIVLGIMAFDIQAGQGAVLQMVNHGLVVAAAFLIIGLINRGTAGDHIDRIGGIAAGAPRLAVVFLFVSMAALAIPGSNAFVGEFFILTGVFRHHVWIAVLATIGVVLAAVYMLRLYQTAMNGPAFGANSRAIELRPVDYVVLSPLVGAMLVIALWPASIVGSTRAPVAQAVAPAQIAAERPADQIERPVVPNPPPEALPLPGDEPPIDEVPAPAVGEEASP